MFFDYILELVLIAMNFMLLIKGADTRHLLFGLAMYIGHMIRMSGKDDNSK